MNIPHLVSTLVVIALVAGVALRRHRRIHPRIMIGAFLTDLGLLVWIELHHHALRQAAEATGLIEADVANRGMLLFHIWVSTLMLVLYAVLIVLGIRLLRGNESVRRYHRGCAVAFLMLRFTNYVTSFLL